MNKEAKELYKTLETKVGDYNAGLLLAILLDSLNFFTEGVDERDMRTIEIKINNFFSLTYDFHTGKYVGDDR